MILGHSPEIWTVEMPEGIAVLYGEDKAATFWREESDEDGLLFGGVYTAGRGAEQVSRDPNHVPPGVYHHLQGLGFTLYELDDEEETDKEVGFH